MENVTLSSQRKTLNTSEATFGWLRPSDDVRDDAEALGARLAEDGYLYLPGALNRERVLAARQVCLERLAESGWLEPGTPIEDAIAPKNRGSYFMPNLAEGNEPLLSVLYDGEMIALFEQLLGEAVRPFDFTWLRAVSPGNSTAPHCDKVYMGRGTSELYTAWTPLGDIPLSIGGLIVLENSHREKEGVLHDYLKQDVDTYCENGPNVEAIQTGKLHWEHWDGSFTAWDGAFSHDPAELREQFGGRWLTAKEYRAGDVLIFTMATMHASLDNRSDQMRLSSDTRYQRASEPVDERWINGPNGERPIAHGLAGKRGKIC